MKYLKSESTLIKLYSESSELFIDNYWDKDVDIIGSVFTGSFFFISNLILLYFLFHLLYLLFQAFILLLCCLVLLLQLAGVYFLDSSHSSFDEVDCVAWFFGFFVEFDKNFGEGIDGSSFFEILFELLFFAFDSSLTQTIITCDIC